MSSKRGKELRLQLHSIDDTEQLARALAQSLSVPMTLALIGSLGAGKTEIARRLCANLGVPADSVTSPTYVLVQRYQGRFRIYHLDFYRLNSCDEAWDLGLDEWLVEPALTIIEWADRFADTWPDDVVTVQITQQQNGSRIVDIAARGARGEQVLERLQSEIDRAAG